MVAVVLVGVGAAAYLQVDQRGQDATADQMLAIARTFADTPEVREAPCAHAGHPTKCTKP